MSGCMDPPRGKYRALLLVPGENRAEQRGKMGAGTGYAKYIFLEKCIHEIWRVGLSYHQPYH